MRKYTANYSYTNPNFVIQNLLASPVTSDSLPILYVLKNILQRGNPTIMSKYLQSQIGEIHKFDNFNDRFFFASNSSNKWLNTIKGDKDRNYYPALEFFERIIPTEFGDYSFVQSLIIPEIEINEIVGEENQNFINQQVDFYLPQAKLVVEIDGQQHKSNEVTRVSDKIRDNYLFKHGVTTIRISTTELTDGTYKAKIQDILNHLARYDKTLKYYQEAHSRISEGKLSELDYKTKILPTAIIRFQILLIELLTINRLTFKDKWCLNVLSEEELGDFISLAVEDILIWIEQFWKLKCKLNFVRPEISIKITKNQSDFKPSTNTININFSLFKRYTDENEIHPDVIFLRTDYFDAVKEKSYFKVSTCEPINYHITDEDKATLEFFLQNIFDKKHFREGQFPIISNALNRNDTIGLLPTGGGKSLCYQLPCLLQPSVNFVVCPIKSLMYDQCENLGGIFVTNVNYITSDLNANERRLVETNFELGRYLFVLISPEKFQIPSFREKISSIIANFSIAYAVIDEVHCLSEWGHDFRTSYLNLAKTIDKLSPRDEKGEGKIKFIGLTATASVKVLEDIKVEFSRQKQRLENGNIISLLDYSRKELQFEVIDDKGDKLNAIKHLLNELVNKDEFLVNTNKAGLIFTPNVNGAFGCYQLSNTINTWYENKVGWFSGEIPKRDVFKVKGNKVGAEPVMSNEDFKKYKTTIQKDFKEDKYQLLVATKAFGMGIDKQNIYYTIHYGFPSSVESLYQEAGRAGRWDKNLPENIGKIGKCYVLHSPESFDKEKVERLFLKETTFAEMKSIGEEVNWAGKDLFKQIFLFTQGQNDIKDEFHYILKVVDMYFKENTPLKIFWKDAYDKIFINEDVLQKVIYRLSLLGVVSDWTTNFVDHFDVQFNTTDDKHIIKHLSNHILKYNPETDVEKEIQNIDLDSVFEKSIWYLLNWTFENIAYNRKQSLKTLSDWCVHFENSESFKHRIDSYFIFTETTFIFQHIAENPFDYEKWFEALSSNGTTFDLPEFQKHKDGLSRFLESYRSNLGLNFLSGFIRLVLNEYDDGDGRNRFESTLKDIGQKFSVENQDLFFNKLLTLGSYLDEGQSELLCLSITKYFPERFELFADYYELPYLLNDIYAEKVTQLKTLNNKLYEQLKTIQYNS